MTAQVLALVLMVPALVVAGSGQAAAESWPVEGERTPSSFGCDSLYYSNYRSGMQFQDDAAGDASIDNTVITKRKGGTPPDYWSSSMALGKDPDSGKPAAFYADYRSSNPKLYKHVSGTDEVTDEIAGGEQRNLPAGVDWGGLTADPQRGMLYGAQNGGAPKLFAMNLATGETTVWSRGDNLKPEPAGDAVFDGGTMVPDMFVDSDGGAYYGITSGGATYIYRLDPSTGTTTRVVKVEGPGSSNGFSNYGMAYHNGSIYLGAYWGALYKVDPRTGQSVQVAGGNAQDNQKGRIQSEYGGGWPITDLASCDIAENLTENIKVRKSATPANAKPGDTVRYTVNVTNEGTGPATGVAVEDDLSGVLDDATYNNDATAKTAGSDAPTQPSYDAAAKKLTWNGDIAAGEKVTLTYSVKVGEPPGGDKKLRNTVTSEGSNCSAGSQDPVCSDEVPLALLQVKKSASPSDPKPGDKVTYTVTARNEGSATWKGARLTDDLSGTLDDATYNNDAAAKSGGSDTPTQPSYDASAKKLSWSGDIRAGETVTLTYSVKVGEPPGGDKRLRNSVVAEGSNCAAGSRDPDPDCSTDEKLGALSIKKSATPAEAKPGDTVAYRITAENTGTGDLRGVTLSDDLRQVLDDADYQGDARAEFGGSEAATRPAYDADGQKLTWTGDIAAGQTLTLTYTVRVKNPPTGDNAMRNTVTGPGSSNCAAGSTDADCSSETHISALDIKKTSSPGKAKPGDKVTYTVTVRNKGKAAYSGASFTDDLGGTLDDARFNDDARASSGSAAYDAGARRLSWRGDVPAGETVTVTYSVTVGKPPQGDGRLKNGVTGTEDTDCPAGDTGRDPDCSTETPIARLELKKTASPHSAKPGQKVTYTVTATNPGTATYEGAAFSDDLSEVLDDAEYNGDVGASAGTADYSRPRVSWRHDLPAGASATITYSVTVKGASGSGDGQLKNAVTGPPDSTCPPGGGSGECGETVPVAAISIKKLSSPKRPQPGDKVNYTVQVVNNGKAAYTGASFTDDLSGVLDDAAYDGDARATAGAVDYRAPKLTWRGDVPAGETVNVTYSVTVDDPPAGDKRLKNAVTSDDDDNCGGGSGEDGEDSVCYTDTPLPALKITKTGSPREFRAGDRVEYRITVENTGEGGYENASFTDDLSGVLDDATYNGDAKADRGEVDYAAPRLTWRGDLDPGERATVTYSVKVTDAGDRHLGNRVTGEGSNCAADSKDPDCREDLPSPHLEIAKSARPERTEPGGTVHYTVTVRNAGDSTYRNATYRDDLSGVLDDASYNGDARADRGTVAYGAPALTWNGDLGAGEKATVAYSVTVGDPPGGDQVLGNSVTSTSRTNCPLPMGGRAARRADAVDPRCSTETPVETQEGTAGQELTLVKRSAPGPTVAPGQKVTYTVTATNTGETDYDDATFTDDLGSVLRHAAYDGDATADRGTVARRGDTLVWNGRLAAGQRVTLTYSVTVDPDAPSGATLRNAVVSRTPGSTCTEPKDNDRCGTTTTVTGTTPPPTAPPHPHGQDDGDSGWLPDTGLSAELLGGAASVLLALGLGLYAVRRNRDGQG
ncbi:isopeptide-forming domain-containing fimbrial protein [Streptomyces sp. ODS28]|uniref:DUF7927 domain-containing protein n=1 Tax=Streptomyces sp. ODS28 TaxID=3136688 RepID=UPI0031EF0172